MKYFNNEDLFAVNDNLLINEIDIGGYKAYEIKNFYKNFDMLLDFVDCLPVNTSFKSKSEYDIFGHRSTHKDFPIPDNTKQKISEIIGIHISKFISAFNFYFAPKDFEFSIAPHKDDKAGINEGYSYAGVLCLNNCYQRNGTGIFKMKTQKKIMPTNIDDSIAYKYRRLNNYEADKDTEIWELLYESSGEINSLFLYPSNLFHSPFLFDKNSNCNRIVQVFFINTLFGTEGI